MNGKISDIKKSLLSNIKNSPGKGLKNKVIVIECDDWGSIRLPSRAIKYELQKAGIPVGRNRFTQYDTLEDKDDLELLFEVLMEVRDKNGKPAVFTPVTCVSNPDFQRIKDSGFQRFYTEPFNVTLLRYGRHPETINVWKKGIDLGIFVPQSHGDTHITAQQWIKFLRAGEPLLRKAFDFGYVSVPLNGVNPAFIEFRPEFYFENDTELPFLIETIKHATSSFKNLFGYGPDIFVPSNSIFHPALEETVAKCGVKYLYVTYLNPIYKNGKKIYSRLCLPGFNKKSGLIYYTRNCVFEPTDGGYQGIGFTLNQIEIAFRWDKPANISTHRVNFVGGIDERNREKGLKELKLLLKAIVKRWPDVEFLSSADMLNSVYSNCHS